MGKQNGQRAQQKRERNAKKAAASGSNKQSQLKSNAAAMSIICQTCRQPFLCTTKAQALKEHVDNKHAGKSLKECFPSASE